jgi:penicillin-binding protein 2
MGGKTGTAQVNQTIDLENNSWFVAFAPYDKPEIAVVVYVPNGYKGALSSYTVKEIIRYYMDSKKLTNTIENLPQANTLVK